MVAVAILSIALLGIMSAISVAQDTQGRAVRMAVARDIAIDETERFRAMGSVSIAQPTPPYSSPDLPPGNNVTRTTSEYPNVGSDKLWRATVTVTWPEGKGSRTIRYDTLFYKP
jgi:hypothetical protein